MVTTSCGSSERSSFQQVMHRPHPLSAGVWQGFHQGFSTGPYIAWRAESSIVATVTMGIETCGKVSAMASTWPLCTKACALIFLILHIYNHLRLSSHQTADPLESPFFFSTVEPHGDIQLTRISTQSCILYFHFAKNTPLRDTI